MCSSDLFTQSADLGMGRLRWSLGELADAVTLLVAVPAAASWPPPAARHRLRAAVISAVATGALLAGCGWGAAAAAFHTPSRSLTSISYHGHHGPRREVCWPRCEPFGAP